MTGPRRSLAVVTTLLMVLLTACSSGSGSDPQARGTNGAQASGPSESSATAGAYPVTVDTAFGEVTVEERPQRVVALGWGDAETMLALGVQPVGASDWLGFGGTGVGPWAEGLYDEPPVIIETLEPSYEKIAALEPDLILDVKSSGDPQRYERLSSIATTVGVPEGGDSYLTSSDEQVQMIATALGMPEEGQALIEELDQRFAQAAAAHPEWEGMTVTAATRTSEGWGAYVEDSERVQFLENLGFVQNPAIAELPASENGFSVNISAERLDLLDADLIVAFPIFIDRTEITEDPLWQRVPAVADGRAVVIDGDLSQAYSLGSPLAIEYAIDNLVPQIEDALGQG